MRIVFNPNFAREIDRQVEHREGKVRIAEEVVVEAKRIAPYRPHKGDHYRDSLGVHVVGPAVYVRSTDWKGHWMEWGSVNNDPPPAPIRKAVLRSGLRLASIPRNSSRSRATGGAPFFAPGRS